MKPSTPTKVSDEMYSLLSAVDGAATRTKLPYVAKTKILNGMGFREVTLKACESRGLLSLDRVDGKGNVYRLTEAGQAVLEDPDGSR